MNDALHAGHALLKLEVIESGEALRAIKPAWNDLLRSHDGRSVFLTHTWFCHWWRHFAHDKTLHVVVLSDSGRVVAIAPLVLYRERLRGLPVKVLGTFFNIHISRTDFIIAPQYRAAATEALAEHFSATSAEWDVVMLRQIPANGEWQPELMNACSRVGLRPFPLQSGIAKCFIALNEDWESYVGSRTHHFRQRLKEQQRRLHKLGPIVYRESRRRSDMLGDFRQLRAVEARSWKGSDEQAALSTDDWRFQQSISLCDEDGIGCENAFFERDGRIVAAVHSLTYDGTIYPMQTMYDEAVRNVYPGRALFARLLESSWGRKELKCFDFNGDSVFCRSWTDTRYEFADLQIYNDRPYSRVLANLKRAAQWAR